MKIEEKRIFISDLPETATQSEIETLFGEYGKVKSVEIKERKELGPKNSTLFFSYVNIEIDDRTLQTCFKDFANNEWHGQYIQLQIARESFLDRLKREREENPNQFTQNNTETVPKITENGFSKTPVKKAVQQDSSSSSESEESEEENAGVPEVSNKKNTKVKIEESSDSKSEHNSSDDKETIDIVIRNNKGKLFDKSALKIASVGNAPIITIDTSKKKLKECNQSEANLKRLQSVNEMKKGYQTQKLQIKAALSNIDNRRQNKIVFDDNETPAQKDNTTKTNNKKSLFEEESDEENFEGNFAVKEQFQGKKGQQLLELQSRFKNDKRFAMDSRFLEDEEQNEQITNDEDLSLEQEKRKEYEILGQVLGKKVTPKFDKKDNNGQNKTMLRFDPSQPEHSKYEMKNAETIETKKRKRNDLECERLNEKKDEETEMPEVSKEIFYKVTDNLKETFQEKPGFSLLSMFGRENAAGESDNDDKQEMESPSKKTKPTKAMHGERNPFSYDSSNDEDETEDIPDQNNVNEGQAKQAPQNTTMKFWTESFFFKVDDYRLQEGFDFMERIKSEEKTEFHKVRRDLKEIVRAKVRNNQRKNRPFKKKLGGNRRKKMIRIKKALKR